MACNLHSIKCFYMHVFTVYNFSKNKKKTEPNEYPDAVFLVLVSCCALCPISLYFISTQTHTQHRLPHSQLSFPHKEQHNTDKEWEKWHAHTCIQFQINCTREFNLCTIQLSFSFTATRYSSASLVYFALDAFVKFFGSWFSSLGLFCMLCGRQMRIARCWDLKASPS